MNKFTFINNKVARFALFGVVALQVACNSVSDATFARFLSNGVCHDKKESSSNELYIESKLNNSYKGLNYIPIDILQHRVFAPLLVKIFTENYMIDKTDPLVSAYIPDTEVINDKGEKGSFKGVCAGMVVMIHYCIKLEKIFKGKGIYNAPLTTEWLMYIMDTLKKYKDTNVITNEAKFQFSTKGNLSLFAKLTDIFLNQQQGACFYLYTEILNKIEDEVIKKTIKENDFQSKEHIPSGIPYPYFVVKNEALKDTPQACIHKDAPHLNFIKHHLKNIMEYNDSLMLGFDFGLNDRLGHAVGLYKVNHKILYYDSNNSNIMCFKDTDEMKYEKIINNLLASYKRYCIYNNDLNFSLGALLRINDKVNPKTYSIFNSNFPTEAITEKALISFFDEFIVTLENDFDCAGTLLIFKYVVDKTSDSIITNVIKHYESLLINYNKESLPKLNENKLLMILTMLYHPLSESGNTNYDNIIRFLISNNLASHDPELIFKLQNALKTDVIDCESLSEFLDMFPIFKNNPNHIITFICDNLMNLLNDPVCKSPKSIVFVNNLKLITDTIECFLNKFWTKEVQLSQYNCRHVTNLLKTMLKVVPTKITYDFLQKYSTLYFLKSSELIGSGILKIDELEKLEIETAVKRLSCQ